MPLLYLDDPAVPEAKEQVRNNMITVLRDYHSGEKPEVLMNPAARMKSLDVVKVLMGIMSTRLSVKKF